MLKHIREKPINAMVTATACKHLRDSVQQTSASLFFHKTSTPFKTQTRPSSCMLKTKKNVPIDNLLVTFKGEKL